MDIAARDQELNRLILEGNALEGFDEFYAADVVMQESADEVYEGKDTNRKREEEFFSAVTELRDFSLKHSVVGDGVSMSTWHMDFTHEEWGDQKFDQVAVRHWNDEGEIEKERFFKG